MQQNITTAKFGAQGRPSPKRFRPDNTPSPKSSKRVFAPTQVSPSRSETAQSTDESDDLKKMRRAMSTMGIAEDGDGAHDSSEHSCKAHAE